jgi:hypothetical protein
MTNLSRKQKMIITVFLLFCFSALVALKIINTHSSPGHPAPKDEEVARKMREKEADFWNKYHENNN